MKKIIIISAFIMACLLADNKPKINLMISNTGDSLYVVTLSDGTKKEFRSIEGARQFRDGQNNDSTKTKIWHAIKEVE